MALRPTSRMTKSRAQKVKLKQAKAKFNRAFRSLEGKNPQGYGSGPGTQRASKSGEQHAFARHERRKNLTKGLKESTKGLKEYARQRLAKKLK